MIELGSLLPASILMIAGILGAAWCVVRGSTIGASAMVEKPETSIWGLILNTSGILILIYGFITALMMMMPKMISVLTLIVIEVLVSAVALIILVARAHVRITYWAAGCGTAVICSVIIWNLIWGGGVGVIPESAWPLLLGAVTMLGAAACAAVCIMVAVKSGSVAMVEKPELSIWSLLFVALGEGLAIYGLIVALLIVMA